MSHKTENIRNIVLLGHSGCGKTSFAENMLFESNSIKRIGKVEEGTTTSDYTNIEKDKKNSIFSTLMHAEWRDNKINIIDTPGSDDLVGEIISALKVCDTGIMLINGANGLEVGTELIWEYMQKFNTAGIFVVNQCDQEKADFDKCLDQARQRFGNKLLQFQYPLNPGSGFNKIVDALRMVVYVFPEGGGRPKKEPIPAEELDKVNDLHNKFVEAAAENDDGLMEKYFEEGSLSEKELRKGLKIALVNKEIYPVFCSSANRNMGSGRIMGFINDIAPSPSDSPPAQLESGETLACDSSNPNTTAFVFKTITEPQVGMITYLKVYSGKLKSGSELINMEGNQTEKINQLFVAEGKVRKQVEQLSAGDIGVTVKLKNVHTNDTLSTKGSGYRIKKIEFPSSRIRTGIVPPSKSDMEKLIKSLHQLEEEDPTLKVEHSAQLKQVLLHGQGQLHLDIIKYRIEKVNGIKMEFEKPRIPYRETITKSADESYRHKKQSGGSGQFAEVHLRIEPYYEGMLDPDGLTVKKRLVEDLDWGGKIALYWCIVGGSIDSKYINAIKKGILQKMMEGPLTGSHCLNIRISIYDGKMHSVDSNDMAFMIAASQAFKTAFQKAKPQLLEPIYKLSVLCSESTMGDVMSDLQTRRAIITGMESEGHYQKVIAKVPLSELYKYSSTLRSITQGKAKFTREFIEYAAVPMELQKDLIDNYNLEAGE